MTRCSVTDVACHPGASRGRIEHLDEAVGRLERAAGTGPITLGNEIRRNGCGRPERTPSRPGPCQERPGLVSGRTGLPSWRILACPPTTGILGARPAGPCGRIAGRTPAPSRMDRGKTAWQSLKSLRQRYGWRRERSRRSPFWLWLPGDRGSPRSLRRAAPTGAARLLQQRRHHRLVALARLSPASGLISVGVRPGMRVVELKVKEDDQVAAGAVLAVLEGHDAARSQLALAEAQKRRAEHERSSRLAAARKASDITRKRLDEGRTLYNQFGATLKGKDRYDAEMALYQVEMQAIKTQLDLELAEGREAGRHDRRSPEEAILKARSSWRRPACARPRSVRRARAASCGSWRHPGELSSVRLLMMGDVSSMVAKAEVYQSDVARIRSGRSGRGRHPRHAGLGQGRADRLDRGQEPAHEHRPARMRDLRVVDVTIELDRAAPANRFVDMEVEAVIRPSGSAGGPESGAAGRSRPGPGMSTSAQSRPIGRPTPPLALRNVMYGGRKTAAAVAGVAFAVTMVLLQLGFYGAVEITATNVYEQLDFDVVLLAATYDQFFAPGEFPMERLRQARSVESVAARRAALFDVQPLAMPAVSSGRPGRRLGRRASRAGAAAPMAPGRSAAPPAQAPRAAGDRRQPRERSVRRPGPPGHRRGTAEAPASRAACSWMSCPTSDFGWPLVGRFDGWELGRTAVRIVGGFPMLRGFAADGVVICSDVNFVAALRAPLDRAGPVRLPQAARPRPAPPSRTSAATLREVLPPDVVPYSRGRDPPRETDHWVGQTATGKLFAFGVLVATIVASAVIYQVLSNDVRDHLAEYATLKAMGHTNAFLAGVVIRQALIYCGGRLPDRRRPRLRPLPGDRGPRRHPDAADAEDPRAHAAGHGAGRAGLGRVHPREGLAGPTRRICSDEVRSPDTVNERDRPRRRTDAIPLAWRNLTENRLRLLASLAGTAFAVTLMFMETRLPAVAAGEHGRADPPPRRPVDDRQPDRLHALRPLRLPSPPDRAGQGLPRGRGRRARLDRDPAIVLAERRRRPPPAHPRRGLSAGRRRDRPPGPPARAARSGAGPGTAMADRRSRTEQLGPARGRHRLRAVGQDRPHPGHIRAGRRLPERRDAGHERRDPGRHLPRPPRPVPRGRRRDRRTPPGAAGGRSGAAPPRGSRPRCRPTSAC